MEDLLCGLGDHGRYPPDLHWRPAVLEHNSQVEDITTLDALRAPLSICTYVLHATSFYAIFFNQSVPFSSLLYWACWFYFGFGLSMLAIQAWSNWFQSRIVQKLREIEAELPRLSRQPTPRDKNWFIGLSGTIMMTLVLWPILVSAGWITMR